MRYLRDEKERMKVEQPVEPEATKDAVAYDHDYELAHKVNNFFSSRDAINKLISELNDNDDVNTFLALMVRNIVAGCQGPIEPKSMITAFGITVKEIAINEIIAIIERGW
jgi:hypothetical protein